MYIDLKVESGSFSFIGQAEKISENGNPLRTLEEIEQALEDGLKFSGKEFELKQKTQELRDRYFSRITPLSQLFKRDEIENVKTIFAKIMNLVDTTSIHLNPFEQEPVISGICKYLGLSEIKNLMYLNKRLNKHCSSLFIQKMKEWGYYGSDVIGAKNYYKNQFATVSARGFLPNRSYKVNKPFSFTIDPEATIKKILDSADKNDPILIKHLQSLLFDLRLTSNIDAIAFLLRCGIDPNILDSSGWAPIHLGIGILEITKMLIHARANLDAKDPQGMTALHHAANMGQKDTVKVLLDNGANPNIIDKNGFAPMLRNTSNPEITQMLLEAGADINARCPEGITTLAHAVNRAQKGTVKVLLDYGADPNALDFKGFSPIHGGDGNPEIILMLVNAGAHVNAQDQDGVTALFFAVYEEKKDTVKVLLDNGADPNIFDKDGFAPMHRNTSNPEITLMLLNAGADVNAQTLKNGKTALHYAISNGHKETVKVLLDHGADESLLDHLGKKASDYESNAINS